MAYLIRAFDFFGFDFLAEIEYTVTSPYVPAKTYGPPENCYPAEGPEWEVNGIIIVNDDHEFCHFSDHIVTGAWFAQLSEFFSDAIAQHIADNPPEDDSYIDDEGWFDSAGLD